MSRHSALDKQIALVTGASRGIGRAIAVELAKRGALVIGTATSEAGATAITDYLQAVRPDAGRGTVLNVNDALASNQLIESIGKEFGGLSILVNNAGITQDQLAMRMKDEDWDAVILTNLTAVARLSRAVLRGMMKAKYGRIISITSVVGSAGNPGQMNYAAAKAGVAGMSRALAREIGSRNITVNCVAPGFIDTDMTKSLNEQQVAALLQQIPAGRFGMPEDVAAAVAFLASDEAGYITGTTLHVNGGMYMSGG
jgi:3-oxoacyl-[acyl-carrier protein] reductase